MRDSLDTPAVNLIVDTFTRLALPLVVIGDGPDLDKIRRRAGPTVRLLGWQSSEVLKDHMERCKAFIFAAIDSELRPSNRAWS